MKSILLKIWEGVHFFLRLMAGVSFICVTADPLLKFLASIRNLSDRIEPYNSIIFWSVAIGWFYIIIRVMMWLFKDYWKVKKEVSKDETK